MFVCLWVQTKCLLLVVVEIILIMKSDAINYSSHSFSPYDFLRNGTNFTFSLRFDNTSSTFSLPQRYDLECIDVIGGTALKPDDCSFTKLDCTFVALVFQRNGFLSFSQVAVCLGVLPERDYITIKDIPKVYFLNPSFYNIQNNSYNSWFLLSRFLFEFSDGNIVLAPYYSADDYVLNYDGHRVCFSHHLAPFYNDLFTDRNELDIRKRSTVTRESGNYFVSNINDNNLLYSDIPLLFKSSEHLINFPFQKYIKTCQYILNGVCVDGFVQQWSSFTDQQFNDTDYHCYGVRTTNTWYVVIGINILHHFLSLVDDIVEIVIKTTFVVLYTILEDVFFTFNHRFVILESIIIIIIFYIFNKKFILSLLYLLILLVICGFHRNQIIGQISESLQLSEFIENRILNFLHYP